MSGRLPLLILAILSLVALSYAYIPAVNSTAQGVADTEDSTITLKWPSGTFQETISYQLAASGSLGISKGALVRVREEDLSSDDYTWQITTPWVALINCDRNSSGASMVDDIFTLIRDRGAIAALLYSNRSDACRINDGYKTGDFDRVIDIFTTKKASTATLIQSQFNSVNYNYTRFNPKLLNESAAAVNASLALTAHDISPFVIANLRAWNATGTEAPNDPGSNPTPVPIANDNNGGGPPSNGLAMIILYVITGSVSALFLIVILTGAVRAFRHPERYGPRAYDPNIDGPEGEGQTRALGIARAVLDTFPVIKWGRNNNLPPSPRSYTESKTSQGYGDANCSSRFLDSGRQRERVTSRPYRRPLSGDSAGSTGAARPSSTRSQASDVVDPAAIGRETCPICIVDFEEGDDVRVLPCPGHHRFHKDCVDPWLLELSTSCPICREDFQALENMATAQDEEQDTIHPAPEPAETSTYPPQQQSSASWFARYMHFAQRKRRSRGHRSPSETGLSH